MQFLKGFLQKIVKKLPVLSFDVLAIPVAWYFAYWLRFNLQPFPQELTTGNSLSALCILMVIQIACYYYFRVYRGLWRYSSLNDVSKIIKATFCATVLSVLLFYLTSHLQHIPRSILPLYDLALITLLCGGRLLRRSLWDRQPRSVVADEIKHVLIIGAGRAGEGLVRDLKRTQSYLPIGFLDDDVNKKGVEVHGVRVLGSTLDLIDLVTSQKVDFIFLAIPSARSVDMRRIVRLCEETKIPFRTLPSLSALVAGRVEVNALRQVNLEDLLGRDQVPLEWEKIASSIHNKRVVVTGGGGSIGAELCRQVMALKPQHLLIIDHSEFNLYKIEQELRERYPQISLQLGLVCVTDKVAMEYLFEQVKPQVVFHAAAYKHVPMLEGQIRVAVQNNVIGTQIVAEVSVAMGVEKFVLISSDKAVNPTNIMGTTKRVAEIYCQNLNERVATQFITVRFGNVLGSTGSVVPLFQKQLQEGGPLTVTHPDIERYFMTIPESCQLILQAMVNGHGGEIFVLNMGEPIKISYLAEQMIRLSGKEPGKDIAIKYIGLRPGEKLFEELFHHSEQLTQTEHQKLLKANFRQIEWQELTQALRLLNNACNIYQEQELYNLLKNLVPEFNASLETLS